MFSCLGCGRNVDLLKGVKFLHIEGESQVIGYLCPDCSRAFWNFMKNFAPEAVKSGDRSEKAAAGRSKGLLGEIAEEFSAKLAALQAKIDDLERKISKNETKSRASDDDFCRSVKIKAALRRSEYDREAHRRLHVISVGGKWAVKREGSLTVYRIFAEKRDALQYAKNLAEQWQPPSIVIHHENGRAQAILQVAR